MENPDEVTIEVHVRWWMGMCLPCKEKDASGVEKAVFRVLTFGDNRIIETATEYEISVGDGRHIQRACDSNEYRRLTLKRNLLRWALDMPIEVRKS